MANFINLPIEVRNTIYKQVLTIRHPLYLFQDSGSSINVFAPDKPYRWPALLYVNRQIYRESSAVLYGMNHFHFIDITERQAGILQSFLSSIGVSNAASVSHLCINFPVAERVEEGSEKPKLRDDSLNSLTLLQERCTSLSTIETVVHFKNSGFFKMSEKFLQGALSLINAHLRAIASLERVIVRIEVDNQVLTPSTRRMMQELRWSIVYTQM